MSKDKELQHWSNLRFYGTVVSVNNRSKENKFCSLQLELSVQRKRHKVPKFWSKLQRGIPNLTSAVEAQLASLEVKVGRDGKLKEWYLDTIWNDTKEGYVWKLETSTTNTNQMEFLVAKKVILPRFYSKDLLLLVDSVEIPKALSKPIAAIAFERKFLLDQKDIHLIRSVQQLKWLSREPNCPRVGLVVRGD